MQRPIESAGVLPLYQGTVLLGLGTDGRVEYPGGKHATGEQAFQTAHNETTEEWGALVIEDPQWTQRAVATRIPNNGKDIYLYAYPLDFNEYSRLHQAAKNLNTNPWPRDFSALTGRTELAKQTFVQIVALPMAHLTEFIENFKKIAPPRDSDKFFGAVKQYCQDHELVVFDICTQEKISVRMRPFNLATLSYQ